MDQLRRRVESISPFSVRPDSKYATKFVDGETTGVTEEQVAHELACVQYLYASTTYGPRVEGRMREMANDLKSRYQISWTDVWSIVRELGPAIVKIESIFRRGGSIPSGYMEV